MLTPRGPAAGDVLGLWWLLLGAAVVAFTVVVGLLVAAIARRNRQADPAAPARWGGPFILVAGVVVSGVVLVAAFVVSLLRTGGLASAEGTVTTIDVVAHDWWWEARYDSGAVTANEIHMPIGVPVRFRLTTADVIHSFWVPELGPKADMIPGRTNELWLQADEPGRYRGQCAEFCGLQHANMVLWVVADEPQVFERWLANETEPAADPVDEPARRGREVFLSSTCVGCHTIRGTPADGQLGPDLTHLAGRDTLASGILPNSRSELSAWIQDPQSAKPGAVMPPTSLSSTELEALLAYLGSLE